MSRGRAQIIPEAGGLFSLVWDVNERIQPGGTQVGFTTLGAVLDAVKPLANALPGALRSVTITGTASAVGQARIQRESGASTWTLQWLVAGEVLPPAQSGLTLNAAINASKALIAALPGALTYLTASVVSA